MRVDADEINRIVDIMAIIQGDSNLKKVANTGGGEWAGPCPLPGCACDKDGFRVQPYNPAGGKWFCRGCGGGRWHSAIDYIVARDKVDFKEALQRLAPIANLHQQQPIKPPTQTFDQVKWNQAARAFLNECGRAIWTDEGEKAFQWLENRGLKFETILQAEIGYSSGKQKGNPLEWGLQPNEKVWLPRGIVTPCFCGVDLKYIKIRRPVGKPKYSIVKGSHGWIYGGDNFKDKLTAFLFEAEFDAMLAFQTLPGVGCASLPAGQNLHPEYQPIFDPIEDLIIAYDQDEAGQAAVDKLIKSIPAFHKAGPLPQGKDLSEFYQAGGDVLEWLLGELDRLKGKE